MPVLFALTLFLGASLLFIVQPMVAKQLLPWLGGTPAVWSVCMVFFQSALLAGYAYAHGLVGRARDGSQRLLHAGLLLLPFPLLPLAVAEGGPAVSGAERHPTSWLLVVLVTRVGLPFLAVASTAPLLQAWFSTTRHRGSRNPYFLYVASNLGSLLALVLYPLAIEPNLPLAQQRHLWSWGYVLLVLLTTACGLLSWLRRRSEPAGSGTAGTITPKEGGRWVFLAFVPSSMMLGVTTFVATDIASVPLLWVVPLALYLLSLIIVFSTAGPAALRFSRAALPMLGLPLAGVLAAGFTHPFWIPLHLITFFAAALVCHGELARRRPPPERLTGFYLAMAAGGALGGLFNGIVAPLVFERITEYPLALVLACLALSAANGGDLTRTGARALLLLPSVILLAAVALVRNVLGLAESGLGAFAAVLTMGLLVLVTARAGRQPARFALALGAVLLASGWARPLGGRLIHQERSFFGVLRVVDDPAAKLRRLFHGNTLHGQQSLLPSRGREPLAYFRRGGPIDQVIAQARAGRGRIDVAVVGLGAGTLAAYASPGEAWTFYEIDPAVLRVAGDPRYFTYLRDSRAASLRVLLGDGRVRLRDARDGSFGLIVLDAFSSDAVPVHLLTREALGLYRRKLAPRGLIAYQITNRYLDLDPVLGRLAEDAGMVCLVKYDLGVSPSEREAGQQPSIWAVMAERRDDLGPLARRGGWQAPRPSGGRRVWTDDYADPLSTRVLFRGRSGLPRTRDPVSGK